MPEVLDEGTSVVSSDGTKVGELGHVIVDRRTLRATAIVVDIGLARAGRDVLRHGLLGEYDRIVDIDAVKAASERRIELTLSEAEFMSLPEYTEEHFDAPPDLTPNQFDITDVIRAEEDLLSRLPMGVPNTWIARRLNKLKDERDVGENTPVWRREPHEKIGEVGKLLLDEQTDVVQAFVIRRGFIMKHDVILPVRYVTEILDEILHVQLSDEELAQLKPYES